MKRREFNSSLLAAAGGALLSGTGAFDSVHAADLPDLRAQADSDAGSLTDVEGIQVGHFTDKRRPTGCTVILCENGATGGVDVRGGAPGTRETDLLNPVMTVQQAFAIMLSGGSAFGLDAASGAMRYLDEKGIGYAVGPTIRVPIVPAAILFDLGVGGSWKIRPTAESGYQACQAASTAKVQEGNVGAGAGATVGKMFGAKYAMKTGIGTASIRVGDTGVVVAAIVAVNAVGDIYDPQTAKIIAGARAENGHGFRNAMAQVRQGYGVLLPNGTNTTIGVVATNAKMDKDQTTKVAQMAHDGYGRAINPTHTPADGDTIFALATGTSSARVNYGMIGALAADAMARAIVRSATQATGIPGYPSYRDLMESSS
jgi:L-aminopeptidase/D-esterase-like protein